MYEAAVSLTLEDHGSVIGSHTVACSTAVLPSILSRHRVNGQCDVSPGLGDHYTIPPFAKNDSAVGKDPLQSGTGVD